MAWKFKKKNVPNGNWWKIFFCILYLYLYLYMKEYSGSFPPFIICTSSLFSIWRYCMALSSVGNSLEQLLFLGRKGGDSGLWVPVPDFNERSGTCLAACKTCCLVGIIERPNIVRESMPRKGVATKANKNRRIERKILSRETDGEPAKLAVGADPWAAHGSVRQDASLMKGLDCVCGRVWEDITSAVSNMHRRVGDKITSKILSPSGLSLVLVPL